MTLLNIAYALKYHFDLILFSQLGEAGISYYNHPKNMILKKTENIIDLV